MGAHSKPSRARRHLRAVALGGAAGAVAVAATAAPAAAAAAPSVNWDPIIACESGGNATAHNPASTASGLFQFLTSSWLAYGGGRFAPTAAQATPAQQYEIADAAYAASGLTPWSASQACWEGRVDVHAPSTPPAAAVATAELTLTAPAARHASTSPAPRHTAPTVAAPRHAAPDPAAAAPGNYTVRPGDTLWGIAVGHDWPELYARNRAVVGANPDLIFPGEHLQV